MRLLLVFLLGCAIPLSAADLVRVFGLDHRSIGNANLTADPEPMLRAESLTGTGDGVRTILGDADSGAFINANTTFWGQGAFMHAEAFGAVNSVTNKRVGTVTAIHWQWGSFSAQADYSSIGATSITYQVWNGTFQVGEGTTTNGGLAYVFSDSEIPRVNPWWRQANGEWGASIEFSGRRGFTLPGGEYLMGTRLFVRPDGATGVVQTVSHIDVYSDNGDVGSFEYWGMQLGMFNHRHTILSECNLVASNGVLHVTGLPVDNGCGPAGVLADFDRAQSAALNFVPIAVASTNTDHDRVDFQVTAHVDNTYGWIGGVSIQNTNGLLYLTAPGPTSKIPYTLWSNGLAVAQGTLTNDEVSYEAITISGRPKVTGFSTELLATNPVAMKVSFDTNAVFNVGGSGVRANQISIGNRERAGVSDIMALSVMTVGPGAFTVVSEPSVPFTPPRLNAVREGDTLVVRWKDASRLMHLELSSDLSNSGGWFPTEASISYDGEDVTAVIQLNFLPPFFLRLTQYLND